MVSKSFCASNLCQCEKVSQCYPHLGQKAVDALSPSAFLWKNDAADVYVGTGYSMHLHPLVEIVLMHVVEDVDDPQPAYSRLIFHAQCDIFLPTAH